MKRRPRPHPLTRPTRKPSAMDRVRVAEFAHRLEAGESVSTAFWHVISSVEIGYGRYRGATERPPEILLRRKLQALLERTVPDVVESAKTLAVTRLGALSEDAIAALSEVVSGEVADPTLARARVEASRVILAALGISERAAMVIATQLNVTRGGSGMR